MEGYIINVEEATGEEDRMEMSVHGVTFEGRTGPGLARCSTKVSSKEEEEKEAAAEAITKEKDGKGRAVNEGSSKRKAVADSSKGKKAATGPMVGEEASAEGVPEGVKDAADVAVATAGDTGVEEWVPGQLIELPKHYVEWILSRKRHVLEEDPDEYYNRMINDPDRLEIYTPEFLEEERQLMRDMAEQYRLSGDKLEKFQEWARIQLETEGRVLVDDTYIANRIDYKQFFAEEFGDLWRD